MTCPRLHALLLELGQQRGVQGTARNLEGALAQVGRRQAKGLCPPPSPLPPSSQEMPQEDQHHHCLDRGIQRPRKKSK